MIILTLSYALSFRSAKKLNMFFHVESMDVAKLWTMELLPGY